MSFRAPVAKKVAQLTTVNAVSPNARTPLVEALSDDQLHARTELAPIGRFGEPSKIAEAVSFLSCAGSGDITGAIQPVDGGMSM